MDNYLYLLCAIGQYSTPLNCPLLEGATDVSVDEESEA